MADTGTPPDNPFENTDPTFDPNLQTNGAVEEALPENTPNVAAKPGKAFLVLGLVGLVVVFLLYTIFFGGKKEEPKKEPVERKVEKRELEPPPLPKVVDLAPTPPPTLVVPNLPEPVDVPKIDDININPLIPEKDAAAKAQTLARMKSNMLVLNGGEGGGISSAFSSGNAPQAQPTDPNAAFAARAAATKVETVHATRIQDMSRTIAQGRVIHATMETALNTDLSAPIRAIVSRDTYGEAGTTPLIPKGSRLIGSYNSSIASGQTRVLVIWTRVIRPDGIDVMLGSPLVDSIGQAGVSGQIDTKFQEIFSRALLSSAINIAMAIGSEQLSEDTSVTTTAGSTQTTGGAATEATTNALNKLGSITDSFIQRFITVPPTILVDQGTPVNVMVNKDLVFPADLSGARVIQ